MYACMHVCMYVYIYIYIYTYTHVSSKCAHVATCRHALPHFALLSHES